MNIISLSVNRFKHAHNILVYSSALYQIRRARVKGGRALTPLPLRSLQGLEHRVDAVVAALTTRFGVGVPAAELPLLLPENLRHEATQPPSAIGVDATDDLVLLQDFIVSPNPGQRDEPQESRRLALLVPEKGGGRMCRYVSVVSECSLVKGFIFIEANYDYARVRTRGRCSMSVDEAKLPRRGKVVLNALKADWRTAVAAKAAGVSRPTVDNWKKLFQKFFAQCFQAWERDFGGK